ncbi:MAG: S-layer homology domain-containing protein, partial [bacterium]|nr:S-layer homology domain-containing protein [bacterium]
MIYNYIDDNMPEWARESVQWCVDKGIIKGTGEGLGLDDKDLKYCVVLHRTARVTAKICGGVEL